MDDIDRKLAEAQHRTEAERSRGEYATAATIEVDTHGIERLRIYYANGCDFGFPVTALEGLAHATPDQRRDFCLTSGGLGLHWEALDVDLYIPALIGGIFGSPAWMRQEVARLNGRKTSPAKAAASRSNGKKGGRPRKVSSPSG